MEKSNAEIKRIREEFKKRKARRVRLFFFTLGFLIFVGVFLLPLMDTLGVSRLAWAPFIYVIMIIIIAAIVFVWRCPVCNALLGDVFNTKYCSKCGFDFSDNQPEK